MTQSLGRLVQHDPRSRNFPADRTRTPKSILWAHTAPVLDQGDLGSCTGNATAQLLNTVRFTHARDVVGKTYLAEDDAVQIYELATQLDTIPGTYPPDDTGSSGLAAAQAGQRLGYFSQYQHAFGFDHFTSAIQNQPVIVGTDWYDSMFQPDARGKVSVSGSVVGGHEYLVLGINVSAREVICLNSWSNTWGVNGRFRISFSDFTKLLNSGGDVTVPISA